MQKKNWLEIDSVPVLVFCQDVRGAKPQAAIEEAAQHKSLNGIERNEQKERRQDVSYGLKTNQTKASGPTERSLARLACWLAS